jgi:hypothetical protein
MRGGHAPAGPLQSATANPPSGVRKLRGKERSPADSTRLHGNTRGPLAASRSMRDAHDDTTVRSTTQRGPTEHDLLKDRGDRAQRGFGGLRAAFGIRTGQLTIRSSRSSSLTSSSLAPTRPRTETPAWCTVSGSPETSGCHQ